MMHNDVLNRYKVGGNWRVSKLKKGLRASRTQSKKGRIYIAIPPASGWPGGDPRQNGWKARGN